MPLECKIQLDKKKGIILTVIGEDANNTQVVTLDGSKVTITVKDSKNTSTIVQMPESIAVKCKTFTIDAESIQTTSTKKTTVVSDGTLDMKIKDRCSVDGSAGIDIQSAKAMNIRGATLVAKADQEATLQSQTVNVKGGTKVAISAASTEVKGSTSTKIDGMTVSIKASTSMDVQGLTTTVKGQMTNVKGSMVKLG